MEGWPRFLVVGFAGLVLSNLLLTAGFLYSFTQNCELRTRVGLLETEVIDLKDRQQLRDDEKFPADKTVRGEREILSSASKLSSILQHIKDGSSSAVSTVLDSHIQTVVTDTVNKELSRFQQLVRSVPKASGAIYIRYGKTVCPNYSNLIYRGQIAGSYVKAKGGSSRYLCLPDDPEYASKTAFVPMSMLSGAQYQYTNLKLDGNSLNNHNAPCAICEADNRATKIMIPSKLRCPDSTWTLEYRGFLMSDINWPDHHRTEYICVDEKPESVPGLEKDIGGAPLYHTSVDCGTLGYCPPYLTNRELTCVVCSK